MSGKITSVAWLLSLLVCVAICRIDDDEILSSTKSSWCVARERASIHDLEYTWTTCRKRNCSAIEPGGLCHTILTCCNRRKRTRRHATYLLDMDYKKAGLCHEYLGKITDTNPSYGDCHYS